MTWKEIKTAVEQAGIKEADNIVEIHCEMKDGGKTLHRIRIGNMIKLAEDTSKEAREAALGCCV